MPRSFPDMKSLLECAQVRMFRESFDSETEDEYRTALADHVETLDYIESCEIRNKVGWDKFDNDMKREMFRRSTRKKILLKRQLRNS